MINLSAPDCSARSPTHCPHPRSLKAETMTDAEGRTVMVNALAATPPLIFQGGLLFDATGRLVVTDTGPIASWNNGLAFDATGALCVTIS